MNLVIYDTEIINAVPPADPALRDPDISYCKGWDDKAGMGISVITAYDVALHQPRVFMLDNFEDFARLIAERDAVVGFNNQRFDDPLLAANGIDVDVSIDLAALIWRAAGIEDGAHPKGLGLDALCRANGIPGKSGNGADAPFLFQHGYFGELIDYCLTDTLRTLQLYRHLVSAGGCIDPRTGERLTVMVPR